MAAPPMTLQRTPFYFLHQQNGARLVDFAGWEMPVQFEGVMAEHRAVRERAGLFDISHMGQVWVTGPGARNTLDRMVTNDIASLAPNRGAYALLCREDGGVVDDLYVYCLGPDRFLVVVNASRVDVDVAWMRERVGPDTELEEQPQRAALALQGPASAGLAAGLSQDLVSLAKNGVVEIPLLGFEMVAARTGYTGEDGFEFFGPAGHVHKVLEYLVKKGKDAGLVHVGLGARDTLRLEMGYSLYGHELDENHSPLQAGLGWAVKLNKPFFVGQETLRKEKSVGGTRRLVALRLTDRGVPRQQCPIQFNGQAVGAVTSGTFSPSLNIGIALGYVDNRLAPKDAAGVWSVVVHARAVPAELVALPFYRKQRG
jgi:aminomethyltransferase